MRLRKAKHTDIIKCASLKTSNSTKISKEKELLTQKCLHKYLDDECTTILVAEDNSGILVYIVFHYDEWNNSIHIDQLYVRLDKQNQGIGSKLLSDVAERAKKQRVRIIFLETVKDGGAIKFYKKNGFKVAGRINGMYDEAQGDAVVMSRGAKEELINVINRKDLIPLNVII
jgi:ribosomal protein S18 acetylase RimI-like enzyme